MELKIAVIAKVEFEGIHSWPECPYEDVAFLREPHRHIFHITVKKNVNHYDREVEIIRLKREIQETLKVMFPKGQMGATSCESLASWLITNNNLDYCQVLEDNENGAEVTKTFNTLI